MENKLEMVNVRFSPEEKAMVAAAAKSIGIPLAVYIKSAAIKAAKEQK